MLIFIHVYHQTFFSFPRPFESNFAFFIFKVLPLGLSSEYLCSNSYCVIWLCFDALRATRLDDGISGHDKRVTAAFERFLD